ncbi:IPT/TIG domain-containing protein [Actinoplanes sp. NPDC026670]|uniref:IPT/TIG domain-containing protein n=1 Tax=Actinoplanes sp. NPDC026670 TaxID=3154700 RepID=UPI0033E03E9B
MRKFKSRSRARLLCAGLTTSAVGASVFLGAPAAFAAVPDAFGPVAGPTGTVVKIDVTSATAFDTGTPSALFFTDFASGVTACPTYTTSVTGQTVVAASGTKIDGDEAQFTVPAGVTLNAGAPRTWKVCVYNSTAAATAALHDSTPPTFTAVPTATLSASSGPSGGGNTINFTAPTASPFFGNAVGLVFAESTTGCPATYGTPGNLASALTRPTTTTASANVPAGVVGTGPSTTYVACFYSHTGGTSATLVGAGAATYGVTLPQVTLSSTVGPWGGGNGISMDSNTNFLLGVGTPSVTFNSSERCPRTLTASNNYTINHPLAGKTRKAADNRLAVTVPALASGAPAVPTPFQMCVYNGTTAGQSLMIASAPYTSSVVHTLTSVAPSAGSALGGSMITVSGTGFPTSPGSLTATLGGLPLTDITPVNDTTFTARTPMHGVERNVSLVVAGPAGVKSLSNAYSFLNSIAVAPNMASTDMKSVTVAVKGIGFLSTTFNATTGDAHIYLVKGTYNPNSDGVNKINGPVSECTDVLPLSDNELICTLRLDQRLNAAGDVAPQIAVGRLSVPTITTVQGSRLITASGNFFTADDIGKPITQTPATGTDGQIPSGSVIVDVISQTQAIISVQAAQADTDATVTVGQTASRTISSAVDTTNGSATITATGGATFTSADIGRVVDATAGIPAGRTIVAVPTSTTATLSSGTGVTVQTGTTVKLYEPVGVPAGAYTLTFVTNGTTGVDTTLPTYSQSTVSANSSFTVAAS